MAVEQDHAQRALGAPARKLVEVGLDELDLRFADLRLVSPRRVAWLKLSIEREGIRNPVLVSSGVEAGRRVLLDGLKRLRVARELGIDKLWAAVLAVDLRTSLVAMVLSNTAHAGLTALEEGWILRRLCRESKMSQQEAGALLGRNQSFVSRRVRLVEELEAGLQDDVRLGLLSPACAQHVVRLPRGSQQHRAAQVVQEHSLTSRQSADLVGLLLATDEPCARHDLLADPLGALARLHGRSPQPVDPRLSRQGQQVERNLGAFETSSLRLLHGLGAELCEADAARLRPRMADALGLAGRMVQSLRARCRNGAAAIVDPSAQEGR